MTHGAHRAPPWRTAVALLVASASSLLAQQPDDPAAARPGEPAQPASPAQRDPYELGYDGGFFVRSPDGQNELVLEGLFQVGLNLYEPDRGRTSEFDLRRIRPELAGRLARAYRFRIEPNFGADEVELEEAWVGVELPGDDDGDRPLLMLGRMKAPFGLEEVRSRRYIDFPRFSILNQFSPAEDHGAFLDGRLCGGALEYGLAIYNGTGGSDTNGSKDVAARLAVHPFARSGGTFENLLVGVAGTWGRENTDVGGDSISNAFDQDVIDFAAGTMLDGDRVRAGVELAWFEGPVMLQSELLWQRQEMSRGGARDQIGFAGAYLSASVVLTGEPRRGWKGVTPASPVDPAAWTGTGAWVLALRLSELRSDRALQRLGFTDPGRYTEHIRSVSLGLNWILNDHALVRHAWVHSFYSDDVLLGGSAHGDEGALMIEWQLHF